MIEREVVTDDGVRLWTVEDGTGPTLVLCHGGPGQWDYLGPVSSMLRDVVRLSGGTSAVAAARVRRRSSPSCASVADLETIRDAFGVEHWIVGGHSWGASLALQYALAYPERTRALLYISGTGIGQAWNRAYHLEADRRRTAEENARLTTLKQRSRTPAEESEFRRISWLSDFATRDGAADLIAQLDAPFDINFDANRQISAETKTWDEDDLVARCRGDNRSDADRARRTRSATTMGNRLARGRVAEQHGRDPAGRRSSSLARRP